MSPPPGISHGKGHQKPIMEYKVISDYPATGDDRRGFREWWYKRRKNLRAILNPEIDATLGLVERVYHEVGKDPTVINMKIGEDHILRGADLTTTMEALDTVFTNKLVSGSVPYVMFKRVY